MKYEIILQISESVNPFWSAYTILLLIGEHDGGVDDDLWCIHNHVSLLTACQVRKGIRNVFR